MARKLKREVRREQIAEAALELVSHEGLRALRMTALARRVHLAPSAIYRHFRGKDEILAAALERFRAQVLDNVRAVCAETPHALDRLERLLMRQARLIRGNATLMPRMAFAEDTPGIALSARDLVAGVLGDFLAAVAAIVAEGQRAGDIRADVPADTVALMFFGLVQPAAILWHLRRGRFNITRHVTGGWRTLRRAIAAR